MNKLLALFKNWLENSSQKQKLTAALLVFSILSTLGLMLMKGASGSTGDPLESTPFYLMGVFVKLIIVLLLIVASSVIFRRWLQPGVLGKRTRQVQLVESVRLSPKQALHLITVGDQQLLVGATDHSISLITQIELDLNVAGTEVLGPKPATDFASLLQTFQFPNSTTKSS